jgi:glycine cleavage system H protein
VRPEDLLYSKTHEWVHIQPDASGAKVATVGITAFALEALTDLVYIELPEVGRKLSAGQPFGEVESVKAVSDLYSPVDGEVVEVNQEIADRLESLNQDPYDQGWLIKVRVTDESGLSKLLDFAAYQKQCAEEAQEH